MDPIALIGEYEKPPRWFSFKKKRSADQIASEMMQSIHFSPLQKWAELKKIEHQFKLRGKASATVIDLKTSFLSLSKLSKWKDGFLNSHYVVEVDVHHPFIKYSNHVKVPILSKSHSIEYFGKEISAVFGSTFSTNKPHRIDDKGNYLLDSAFGAICLDDKREFNGYALALGDGAGGHFGEPVQDERIARASHIATKTAVRLFSSYNSSDILQKDIQKIPAEIAQEIKSLVMGEGSTLVCCRVFPVKDGYRLIGFNLGDGMLIGWDPVAKKEIHLLASHVTEAGSAFFPETFKQFEIQYLDTVVPNGSYLYLMSDGVHDTLPYVETQATYPNQLIYRIRSLTQLDKIWGDLSTTASAKEYLQAIVNKSFEGAETLRQTKTSQPDVQIGDDFSILQCHLR